MMTSGPLWQPSDTEIAQSVLTQFMILAEKTYQKNFDGDYQKLWQWSVDHREAFWSALWEFCDIIAETRGARTGVDLDKMPGAKFFPDAKLNFAENLLRPGRRKVDPTSSAIIFQGEDKVSEKITWDQLEKAVSRTAQALAESGVGKGDRVAGIVANAPETIVAMLAATSLGAVWSSCSPDFGVQGILDRFGQIEPKVLFVVDGYYYGGKSLSVIAKAQEVLASLPTVKSTIILPYLSKVKGEPVSDISQLRSAVTYAEFINPYKAVPIKFAQVNFNDPLYIMFSSGTTGVPKCIVHGVGGTLLQQLKEHRLHCNIGPAEKVFYFTTCGWMMWNWLVSALASEATLVLFDGNPFYPSGNALFDLAEREGVQFFGTSAKFIDALAKSGLEPKQTHDLTTVRAIASTGSPLLPESFDYVYQSIKSDVHLASISGGTDILSCFILGNPNRPVWRGEIQSAGLGMAVAVFDDSGQAVKGEKGELVCTKAFPSMPIGFWKDEGGKKYQSAYFDRFPNIWCHGDYIAQTEHDGFVVYGRSDAVLNPGGVRIGTSEIYRQVERLPEVMESLVIGQDWEGDVRVVLFIRLARDIHLTPELEKKIKDQIRTGASPRHVPAKILEVTDIPRTKSGKIVELAVRDIVHGRQIKNKEALANPEALDLFVNRPELRS